MLLPELPQNAMQDVEEDPVRDHQIYQALVLGMTPIDAAIQYAVPLEHVLPIRDELPAFMRKRKVVAATRKELQLARLDLAVKALMPGVEAGSHEDIDMYLKVAKREASLMGLDAPTNANIDVRSVQVEIKYSNPNFNRSADDVVDVTDNSPWREPEPERAAIPGKLFSSDPFAPDPRTKANRSS